MPRPIVQWRGIAWLAGWTLLLPACSGNIGDPAAVPARRAPTGQDPGSTTHPTTIIPETPAEPLGDAFAIVRAEVDLLPFEVRLGKLAAVLGLTPADALFEDLRAKRIDLGDGDYANGIRPDRAWSASRMAVWVKLIRPICASRTMRLRYPELPRDLPALILAAHGRHETPADQTDLADAFAGIDLDDAARYQATCLAVLTSVEFVSR